MQKMTPENAARLTAKIPEIESAELRDWLCGSSQDWIEEWRIATLDELLRRKERETAERCAALVESLWKPAMLSPSARQVHVDPSQYADVIRALT